MQNANGGVEMKLEDATKQLKETLYSASDKLPQKEINKILIDVIIDLKEDLWRNQ